MFTEVTFQDWQRTPIKDKLIQNIITKYKASHDFQLGLTANAYFNGSNTQVGQKRILQANVLTHVDKDTGMERKVASHREVVGNRLANGFLHRFVVQQNNYLLSYGAILDKPEEKEKLGADFDRALMQLGELALLHGVSWGFWNVDHLEVISAARDIYSGFVALLDEFTGLPRVGIQFWQLDNKRPLCVRLFEEDGVTMYRDTDGGLKIVADKRSYNLTIRHDVLGDEVVNESNYGVLPVIPFYANNEKRSELTDGLKAKIDAYDNIMSDLADNLDRANDVYWVLNNFGGSSDDVLGMLDQIRRLKAVVSMTDGMGGNASAEPHTIEVPYQARQTALTLLRQSLFSEYMALDMDTLKGGSLTNVAIKAAMTDLNLKADRYEWQVSHFVRGILQLVGIDSSVSFKRSAIQNDTEIIQSIYQMRNDIDLQTALELNPRIDNDMIPTIMQRVDAEQQTGYQSMNALQNALNEDDA